MNEASREIPRQYLDCSRAREAMDWHPRWSVEDALRETIDWYADWLARRDGGRVREQPAGVR
jgi:CDP-glucose 4,6-dehydratase